MEHHPVSTLPDASTFIRSRFLSLEVSIESVRYAGNGSWKKFAIIAQEVALFAPVGLGG
jgi:hypothetical protein